MVVGRPNLAVARAHAFHDCDPGMCLAYTRTWLDIAPLEPNAIGAWDNSQFKHPGDRNPPRGAPCFWRSAVGGSGNGHAALSNGWRRIRSTDQLNTGQVMDVDLDYIERDWGMEYLGWTEDVNGVLIPYLATFPWAAGTVYVSKLVRGQKDSDSVSRLRYRLQNHDRIPEGVRPGLGNDWGPRVTKAVAFLQTEVQYQINGPRDGSRLSNPQANALFGPVYDVVEAAV